MKESKDNIIIFTSKTARKLLRAGYTIIDIKPDKTDPDKKRSVFVFRNDAGLVEKIYDIQSDEMSKLLD
ncbi:MAG: hypothetical protein LUD12_16050 [Lachnospiraceae bacterium]|nr:hypothetical protein [Lachnospiraceae bacterium]